ncbi:MAG TPA: hypothetical protein VNW52_03660 [Burkholderiaceae bacterium]|nr:hypothetical protein [Burkholderiaceae bacterium]
MRNSINARIQALLGARLHLSFTQQRVTVLRRPAGLRSQPTVVAELPLTEYAIAEPQRLVAQCTAILGSADCAGLPLCVTLTDESVRLFTVSPPHHASRLHDLQAAAVMRFVALYGDAPSAWNLQADWDANAPFLACAVPHTLLSALQQVALQHNMPLLSVTPRFVTAWNQYQRTVPADTWFGVVQDQHLTLGVTTQTPKRRLEAVRSIAIPDDGQHPRWLQDQLARAALQLNLSAPKQIQLVGNRQHWWGGVKSDAAAILSTLAVQA